MKKKELAEMIILEFHTGSRIEKIVAKAIKESKLEAAAVNAEILKLGPIRARKERPVRFYFCGITIFVNSNSDADLVYRDWLRAISGSIDKTIGPDYKADISPKELANELTSSKRIVHFDEKL